jgi:hypothetical protein
MARGNLAGWIVRVLVGLTAGLLLRAFMAADTLASHPWLPDALHNHKHLKSMTDFATENYCVDVGFAPPMAHADALARVAGPLRLDYPSGDWNGLKGGRVAFGQRDWQCSQPPGSAGIELKFYVENSTICPLGHSCAFPDGEGRWNNVTGHNEYETFTILLLSTDLQDNGFYHHLINHETGHALGLKDGGPGEPDPGPIPCQASIMHDVFHGCSVDYDYPTNSDRVAVSEMIPVASGLGRSFNFFGP